MPIIRKLEANFPTLESAGCKVGIGVATGADAVFIGSDKTLDVEPSRKLPLVTTKDIRNGRVAWGGSFVLNPFTADGELVNPDDFPKFRAYSPRMRGNFLRFQAQYLRRIRIPQFEELDRTIQKSAMVASLSHSQSDRDQVIRKLYGLSSREWDQLEPAILTV